MPTPRRGNQIIAILTYYNLYLIGFAELMVRENSKFYFPHERQGSLGLFIFHVFSDNLLNLSSTLSHQGSTPWLSPHGRQGRQGRYLINLLCLFMFLLFFMPVPRRFDSSTSTHFFGYYIKFYNIFFVHFFADVVREDSRGLLISIMARQYHIMTEEEIQFLKDHSETMTFQEMADVLHLSMWSVARKCQRLGLHKYARREEIEKAKQMYPHLTAPRIAKAVNMSVNAVYQHAKHAKMHKKIKHPKSERYENSRVYKLINGII